MTSGKLKYYYRNHQEFRELENKNNSDKIYAEFKKKL